MNQEEIENHHFNERLCYHQYENWGKLIYAEEKEAEQLDVEYPGLGTAFLEKLKLFWKGMRLVVHLFRHAQSRRSPLSKKPK